MGCARSYQHVARRASSRRGVAPLAVLGLVAALGGCEHHGGFSLSKQQAGSSTEIPKVPVPPENGPKLASIADLTPVLERPAAGAPSIGYLHAGDRVARAAEPYSRDGCADGWYPVRPAGFVCASGGATTDLSHPTLAAMAIQPNRENPLPYAYARTVRDTTRFEADPKQDGLVHPLGVLPARSGLAVVGSYEATDDAGKPRSLAMTTDGHFVPRGDLEAASASTFSGLSLSGGAKLPVAFVVKRGVHDWALRGDEPEKRDPLTFHTRLALTGHYRKIGKTEFWQTTDERYVRLPDVTLVRERHEFPDFAEGDRRWLDVSVVTGTLVAYSGKTPVFVTLASVGRDRLGAPGSNAVTTRGELTVTGKDITVLDRDPASFAEGVSMYDAPFALELSSGQLVVGAYWHDRFGIEHGPGNVEVSPPDAARLFQFAEPELPEGWHAVRPPAPTNPLRVVIRK